MTICCGDGVLLYLHRKNLDAISKTLQTSEFLAGSDDGVVALPESSEILRIVFLFIYPNRHPNLRDQEFETLLEISDAVQKYKIFAAMETCEMRLMWVILLKNNVLSSLSVIFGFFFKGRRFQCTPSMCCYTHCDTIFRISSMRVHWPFVVSL